MHDKGKKQSMQENEMGCFWLLEFDPTMLMNLKGVGIKTC